MELQLIELRNSHFYIYLSRDKNGDINYLTVDDEVWNHAICSEALALFGIDWDDDNFEYCQQQLHTEFKETIKDKLDVDVNVGWDFLDYESPTYKRDDLNKILIIS